MFVLHFSIDVQMVIVTIFRLQFLEHENEHRNIAVACQLPCFVFEELYRLGFRFTKPLFVSWVFLQPLVMNRSLKVRQPRRLSQISTSGKRRKKDLLVRLAIPATGFDLLSFATAGHTSNSLLFSKTKNEPSLACVLVRSGLVGLVRSTRVIHDGPR